MYSEKDFTYKQYRQPNRNNCYGRDKTVDGLKTGHTDCCWFLFAPQRYETVLAFDTVCNGDKSDAARAVESQKTGWIMVLDL